MEESLSDEDKEVKTRLMTTLVDHDLKAETLLHCGQVSKYHEVDEQIFSWHPFLEYLDAAVSYRIVSFCCFSTSWTCCGLDSDLATEISPSENSASDREIYGVHLSVLPGRAWYYLSAVEETEIVIFLWRGTMTAALHIDC